MPQVLLRAAEGRALPVAELLERLRSCSAPEFEALCTALAQRIPQVGPEDALLLADALVSALHTHLSPGSDSAAAALLDEVCGSWASTRLLPEDTLRALLRVLLRGLSRASRAPYSGECHMKRSKSSPVIKTSRSLQRLQPQLLQPCGSGHTADRRERAHAADIVSSDKTEPLETAPWSCQDLVKDTAQLPIGDVRLLQVILRLVSQCERGNLHREEAADKPLDQPAHSAATLADGSSGGTGLEFLAAPSAAVATGALCPRPPREDHAHAAGSGWQQDACRIAEVHDMAQDDSSENSGYQSEESIDWSCGRPQPAACRDAPSPPGIAIQIGAAAGKHSQVLCPRLPRCKSMPAGLRVRQSEEESAVVPGSRDLQAPPREGAGGHILQECLHAQVMLREECASLRQNQLLVLNAVQDTARMVAAVHGALEEERTARQAEREERVALREDIHAVTAQVGALVQGQLELQQCVAAVCARVPTAAAPEAKRTVESKAIGGPQPGLQLLRRPTAQRTSTSRGSAATVQLAPPCQRGSASSTPQPSPRQHGVQLGTLGQRGTASGTPQLTPRQQGVQLAPPCQRGAASSGSQTTPRQSGQAAPRPLLRRSGGVALAGPRCSRHGAESASMLPGDTGASDFI